jgi:hypothetical protein
MKEVKRGEKGRNRGELRENERTGDKERGEDVMREWGDREKMEKGEV